MGWVQIACIATNRNVPSNSCCYRKNKIYLHPQQILPKRSQNWHRPGALAFLNQQKFIRGQTRNSGKALLGPLLQQGGAKTSESFPCSLPKEGCRLVPYMGRGLGCVQALAQRGYLGGLPTPWVVLRAGGIHSTLLLFLALQKWWLGFVFFILLSRICPICACMQLFLVPYNFFVFCCSRRRLSRRKHSSTAAKGLRSQPVSE